MKTNQKGFFSSIKQHVTYRSIIYIQNKRPHSECNQFQSLNYYLQMDEPLIICKRISIYNLLRRVISYLMSY
jgi:hypothetical protein